MKGERRPVYVSVGEMLVDMISVDPNLTVRESVLFRKAPGGAPANVAVGLARLGCEAAFVGKVADDQFGHFLLSVLEVEGVDTHALVRDPRARTPLAFVGAGEASERAFLFYHRGMADTTMRQNELDSALLERASVVHFGSVTLTAEPGRSTTLRAVQIAKGAGALISFDPNLRLELWEDASAAVAESLTAIASSDIVKVSLDELRQLTGLSDWADGAASLLSLGPTLVVVTLGADGAYYRTAAAEGYCEPFAVTVMDATGAGDGFMAGLLAALDSEGDPKATVRHPEAVARAVEFATAAGALTTTEYGAIPALPRPAAVARLLEMQPTRSRLSRARQVRQLIAQEKEHV